jgi:L-ascorbate metabolism protein UlaG (beta-lactamase superfamily)
MISEALFPRWRPMADVRPTSANPKLEPGGFRLRWLGTAGYIVETPKVTVLIDPFVSRPSLPRVALGKLRIDREAVERYIPARVDAVCCGHAHFDHLLDAPLIARERGALFVASATGAAFARAHHVAREKIVTIPDGGKIITVGDLEIRLVPSLHGKILFGQVPFPGTLDIAPSLPARAWHYKMGGAFGIFMQAKRDDGSNGASLYHNGSADLIDAELDQMHADVLLVGLAGRQATRDYLHRLVSHLTPAVVIPSHHDAFFAPLAEGVRLLPRIDLQGFLAETRSLAPNATRITPEYGEEIVVPASAPRDAKLRAGTGFVI